VGELALFRFSQDGKPHYALGQITEVQLRNIWLEDPTMRSLARQRGQVNPVSGQQDTHLGKLTISAVFGDDGNRFEPSILGTVPATGTSIQVMFMVQHLDYLFGLNILGLDPMELAKHITLESLVKLVLESRFWQR